MAYEWLKSEVTTIAWCWKLTRKDGTVLGFTSHDRDINLDGIVYEASTGFTPTAIETSRDMAVDNMDVEGFLDSEKITEHDLTSGKYDFAEIVIFICNWMNLTDKILILRKGSIGEISTGTLGFKVEVRGLLEAYQQASIEVFQKQCRATLGDAKCKVNLAGYTYYGTVTKVNIDGIIETTLTNANGFFDYGYIKFMSGENADYSYEIKKSYLLNGTLETFLPFIHAVAIGDSFMVVAGCDGNFSTCKKFSNQNNFRGEPHVPGSDYQTAYPGQGDANTVTAGSSVKR